MDLVYPPVIVTARTVFWGLGLRFRVAGAEHIPRSGGAVLAINHTGYLDFTFAGLAARPSRRLVRFMAKHDVFAHPVSGPLMRGMHHIPVDRESGAESYAHALAALRAGEVVGVFPEATISRSFELKGFKSGAARLALDSGTPLLPVVIWGSQRVWTKGRPKPTRRRPVTISITVGAPVPPAGDADATTVALRASMTELLHAAQASYPESPAGPDDRWWLPARLGGTAPTLEAAEELDAAERRDRAARRAARRQP